MNKYSVLYKTIYNLCTSGFQFYFFWNLEQWFSYCSMKYWSTKYLLHFHYLDVWKISKTTIFNTQEFNLYSFHCCVCIVREYLQVYEIDVWNSLSRIDLLGIESRIKILIIKIEQISKYQLSIYQNSSDAWYLPPGCIGNDIMC